LLEAISFSDVAAALLAREWTFAKTMPQNPHEYTLRKKWSGNMPFETVAQFIRDHGYVMRFGRSDYRCLDINGLRYWTMGAPLPQTTLINRASNASREHPCDQIASAYDGLHRSPCALLEDAEVIERIGYAGEQTVLDIGCGTGLFLDHHQCPSGYLGIDPSAGMLAEMRRKHPRARTMQTPFESFWSHARFDLIIGLFGAPSYVSADALQRVPDLLAPGGRYFLMFYDQGYVPVTHQRSGVFVPFEWHPRSILPGNVSKIGNFFAIEGHR